MIYIEQVPNEFLNFNIINYPLHNTSKGIEGVFYDYLKKENSTDSNLTYLPIQWTSYLIEKNYGKNIDYLKEYCRNLTFNNQEKKFFTIVQYDGGPLVEIDNCLIFSSAGIKDTPKQNNLSYIPIPLITAPHNFKKINNKRYQVGYIGRNTHEVRSALEETLGGKKDYYIKNLKSDGIRNKDLNKFRKIISNSIFSLCPRGFGPTSFRFYESIEMESIPIYISDEFILPYTNIIDWEKLCLLIDINDIGSIPKKVESLIQSNKHLEMIEYGQYCYKEYFNNSFIIKNILNTVSKF
tara:strand:- start:2681 stop:3565 length:885 start_codon:yes stop_codon:yes gene_type:complete